MSPSVVTAAKAPKTTRTMVVLCSLLTVVAMLFSACGNSGNSVNQASNGILTVVPSPIGDFTSDFTPFSTQFSYGTQGMIYETLLFFNRMDGSVHPWLASSYTLTPDARSVTFHLRQGVTWSDGQPFTSADVLFTLNMLKQYPAADLNALWKTIKNVVAPDASTVIVTFQQPAGPFLWYLGGQTWIVPKHLWANIGDPSKYSNPNPVGTGPFLLKSFTPQLIDLVKNPNYWQPGKPAVKEIRFPSFDSNTGAELLLSRNEVDWTGLFTPNIQQTFVQKDAAHHHYWFPPSTVVTLYLNTAKAPFNRLAVRQAISDAIDRDTIYKVAESNYEPVAHPTGVVLPANKSFLSPDLAGLSFSVDTAKSTQLLDSAGFKKGTDGIYVDPSSGKRLSFNLNVISGWTDWVTACQIMADNLKAIGIEVKVNGVSATAYGNALQLGDFDMAIGAPASGPTPYYSYNANLNSVNTAPIGQAANSNWERWSDPTTDTLLKQFASTTDSTVQQQAIYGLEKIMVDQVPTIPLVYAATWYEYNSSRFTGWPDQNNAYAMPAPWAYPDSEVVALNIRPI